MWHHDAMPHSNRMHPSRRAFRWLASSLFGLLERPLGHFWTRRDLISFCILSRRTNERPYDKDLSENLNPNSINYWFYFNYEEHWYFQCFVILNLKKKSSLKNTEIAWKKKKYVLILCISPGPKRLHKVNNLRTTMYKRSTCRGISVPRIPQLSRYLICRRACQAVLFHSLLLSFLLSSYFQFPTPFAIHSHACVRTRRQSKFRPFRWISFRKHDVDCLEFPAFFCTFCNICVCFAALITLSPFISMINPRIVAWFKRSSGIISTPRQVSTNWYYDTRKYEKIEAYEICINA